METRQKRVLVVEDNEALCADLCRMLGRRRLDATCCATFAEALACVRSIEVHCIVLDLDLPDSPDRMDTVARIPEFDGVPVVVLTGSDDPAILRAVRQHGASFRLKGVRSESIMEAVLMQIEYVAPSPEIEHEILSVQRANVPKESGPWFLKWVPLAALAITMLTAASVAGAHLYRAVAGDAVKATQTEHRVTSVEEAMKDFRRTMENIANTQVELVKYDEQSSADRKAIHGELAIVRDGQSDIKADLVRRMERIEDGNAAILKEVAKR